jgi:hypothetical protein
MRTNKIVIVVWSDAHSEPTWMDESEIDNDPYLVHSVGFKLRRCKKGHLSIAQSVTDDGNIDHVIHIPKAMIVSMQEFKS